MLRFAASPTGDMNIGNLRTAIFNYIVAKQKKEDLLIRIDDTNKENNIEGKDKELLELLSLFSIEYSQIVYQSENLKYHQRMAMQLLTKKEAFSCFCSDNKLQELKDEAQVASKPYLYDGFCATLSEETVFNCTAAFTVRIKASASDISFKDELKGNFNYKACDIDSSIILKHDKTATATYACAVDDMLYDISTVIREENHLLDTVNQISIRHALSYDKKISYVHLPAIMNERTNEKISSNERAFLIKSLIEEGFLPSAIANYLVLLSCETPKEIFSLEEAILWFDITKISKNTAVFDINKLRFVNKAHLKNLDNLRLSKILGFADENIGKLAKVYLEETSTVKEIKNKLNSIFSLKSTCKGFEEEVKVLQECLIKAPYFDNYCAFIEHIMDKTSLSEKTLSTPLMFLLTGEQKGPEMSKIYPLIKNYLGEIVK